MNIFGVEFFCIEYWWSK